MSWKTKKPEARISDEAARAQVQIILDHYQIDVEGIPDSKVKAATEGALEKLVTFARAGLFEVAASPFKITQHLQQAPGDVKDIAYPELAGKHKVAMDAHDPNAMYQRIYAMMGSLCELGGDALKRLSGIDLSCMECLGMLFLSA